MKLIFCSNWPIKSATNMKIKRVLKKQTLSFDNVLLAYSILKTTAKNMEKPKKNYLENPIFIVLRLQSPSKRNNRSYIHTRMKDNKMFGMFSKIRFLGCSGCFMIPCWPKLWKILLKELEKLQEFFQFLSLLFPLQK